VILTNVKSENFLKNYLNIWAFAFPFILSYIPLLTEVLSLKSPFIIAFYYGPLFLSLFLWPKELWGNKNFRCYLIIVGIAFVTLFWSMDLTKGITSLFLLSSSMIAGYLIYLFGYKRIWSYFSWGMFFYTVLLKMGILYKWLETYNYGGQRLGYIEGEFAVDPNFLGLYIGFALFYFATEFLVKQKYYVNKLYRYIHFLVAVIMTYFLYLTLSRTIILSVIIIIISLGLLISLSKVNNFKFFLKFLSTFLIICAVVFIILLNSSVSERFSGIMNDDRLKIWSIILELIDLKGLYTYIGYGLGSSDLLIGKYFEGAVVGDDGIRRFSSHNLYLDWLLQTGVISFIYLIAIIIFALKTAIRKVKSGSYVSFLLILFFGLSSIGINTFGHYSFPFLVGLILATLFTSEGWTVKEN
jgi:O-antigen ligase